jgi:hypothetical protein
VVFVKRSVDDLVGGLADGVRDLRVQPELDIHLWSMIFVQKWLFILKILFLWLIHHRNPRSYATRRSMFEKWENFFQLISALF